MRHSLNAALGIPLDGGVASWRRSRGRIVRPRPTKEPELFERVEEPYPGGTLLEDLSGIGSDLDAAQRILARFAAARLILLVLSGGLSVRELELERVIARSYIEVLPAGDAERRVLMRFTARVTQRLARPVTQCAIDAGDLAAERHHVAGAYWLYLTAYELALGSGWTGEAVRAARAIERVARAKRASRVAKLWRRRSQALERAPD